MGVFTMPSLGADMEAGKLVEWLVRPGDSVSRGDVVAVVETQKGAIEIEIFEAGRVAELLAEVGQTLPVGAPLARLGEDEGAGAEMQATESPEPTPAPPPAPVAPPRAQPAAAIPAATPAPASAGGALASPAARQRAAGAGIDLGAVTGSGPGGAVLLADVERALAAPPEPVAPPDPATPPVPATPPAPAGKPGLDMAEMRKAIAAAMTRSKREIPHYYLSHEIDLQAAADWLGAHNAARPPDERLLMGALLVRASLRALDKVPELNGRFEGDTAAPAATINAGIAIALRGGGLIAPAILDAGPMALEAIMAAMRDLVARTRAGRLRNSEVTQGTITISALGETGVDALYGVIYPPQVALVGFGTPRPRALTVDGAVAVRMGVTATLAADHRVSDGRRGALYLAEIARLLQEPESL